MCSLKSQQFFCFVSCWLLRAVVVIIFFRFSIIFHIPYSRFSIIYIITEMSKMSSHAHENQYKYNHTSTTTHNKSKHIHTRFSLLSILSTRQIWFFSLFSTNSSRCLHACSRVEIYRVAALNSLETNTTKW